MSGRSSVANGSTTFGGSQENNNEWSAKSVAVNDDRLTDELVCRVMGWRVAPGRFIKAGQSWTPRHRFAPLIRLDDAFQLLDRVATGCKLTMVKGGRFVAEVQVGTHVGKASGERKARTVTLALARALEVDS
jgi:hypothetical protein